jgi:hypothetical protein
MNITVSENAVEKLVSFGLNKLNFLRLGQDKIIFEQGSVRVVADQEFLPLLDGLQVDFSDDLIQPGLILKNPNAESSCGCGSSFKLNDTDCSTCGGCGS